jgi:ABC-type Mn2+/Zn2+ transport system permease subunit
MGTLVSAVGVYLSLKIDLPTGATIVCTFGLVLIAMALARGFIRRFSENHATEPAALRHQETRIST